MHWGKLKKETEKSALMRCYKMNGPGEENEARSTRRDKFIHIVDDLTYLSVSDSPGRQKLQAKHIDLMSIL